MRTFEYIPVFYQRLSKLTKEIPSELHLSHLGIAFESPRDYVWMALIAKLVAITWPLVTYRVPLVNCLITEVIPHGPEHACVWIYSCFLSETNETNSRDALRIAFESPRNCVGVTSGLLLSHFGIAFELPSTEKRLSQLRIAVWVTSEMRLSHLGIAFESPRNCLWVT